MGHNIQKCAFLAIRGALDFLSYREKDELSADAADADAADAA